MVGGAEQTADRPGRTSDIASVPVGAARVALGNLPTGWSRGRGRIDLRIALLALGLLVLVVVSFGLGRYLLAPWTVVQVLIGQVLDIPVHWTATDQTVVIQVRLPRIVGALLVGAALSASGAAYQTAFRNPLVSPEILGVAAAAGFGASLALLLGLPPAVLQVLAFGFGVLAAVLSLGIGRIVGGGSTIVLVLGGMVVGAMFQALIQSPSI